MQRWDQLVPVPILLMCHIHCFMIGRTNGQSAFGGQSQTSKGSTCHNVSVGERKMPCLTGSSRS